MLASLAGNGGSILRRAIATSMAATGSRTAAVFDPT